MVNKNILDNLTGQEIKEMISENKIELEKLDASSLWKLMDYEADLVCLGNGDEELVSQCAFLLNKLEPPQMIRTDFINIIEKTKEQYVTIVPEKNIRHELPKKRVIFKRVALIAAVVAVIMATTVVIASAFGFDVFGYLSEIAHKEDGEKIDIEGFTFYNSVESKYYSSLEEILAEYKWDIMYPRKFPENVNIKEVSINVTPRGNDEIRIYTSCTEICIFIEQNVSNEIAWAEHDSFCEVNGVKYYIFQRDGRYIANAYYMGDYYYIQANNYDDLIFIINNLKE